MPAEGEAVEPGRALEGQRARRAIGGDRREAPGAIEIAGALAVDGEDLGIGLPGGLERAREPRVASAVARGIEGARDRLADAIVVDLGDVARLRPAQSGPGAPRGGRAAR